jgi:signal transduction histidine kinase
MINSLRGRILSVLLAVLAALLPFLYLGISGIVQEGYAEGFVNSVRTYSGLVADELEASDAANFDARAEALLDGAVLSGQVVFAEVTDGTRTLRSKISPGLGPVPRGDDFFFGEHGDQAYYITHTIKQGDQTLRVRMGFDEKPTHERIKSAKRHVLLALAAFLTASVAMAIWLSAVLARPLVSLQEAAQRIAAGQEHATLQSRSSLREVRELNDHLEHMRQRLVGANEQLRTEIREREASEHRRLLLERQLLHRERIASIGTLAGGMAHEFNNVMTPILLYSQMALGEVPPDSSLSDDLRRVIAAAHRARNLVNRILTFSRGMDQQETSVFPLRTPVEEALALLRAIVPENVEIIWNAADDAPAISGDPSVVQQIVINLCTNAYQAMQVSGGRLTLRIAAAAPAGAPGPACALLEVGDTGHGIDPALLPHIFEPFFTTREVGEGTGLGLSVVHGLVDSLGGFITVESVREQGTTFRVYFPAATHAVAEPRAASRTASEEST